MEYPYQHVVRGQVAVVVPFEVVEDELPPIVIVVPWVFMNGTYENLLKNLVDEVIATGGTAWVRKFATSCHIVVKNLNIVTYEALITCSLDDRVEWVAVLAKTV